MRFASADDVWLMGQNYWFCGGYSIGTPVLGMCLNINSAGNVNVPNNIKTPEIMVDKIKATTLEHLTIDANAVITGSLSAAGVVNLGNRLTVVGDGYSGTLRCVPLVDGSESSLFFFTNIEI